jgi:hypothetical protein
MASKRKVLENARRLGESDWKNQVFIELDKTRQERKRDYELRLERRTRMQNGETNLVIRNGEIVKLNPLGVSARGGHRGGRGRGRGLGRQGGGRL